ncbi:EamA family transporter [Candidatus Woesearchaeota archaeon]|nr:EamA family transporter [Candidatus Woesearchaeota archaeon]
MTELWAVLLVLIATTVGSFGPIFLKKASHKLTRNVKKLITNYHLYIGILFYALGTILFIPALKGGDLSVLYPLVALVYVWVSLLSMRFLNEKMNRLKWFGIVLIIVGVSFIGLGA